MRCFPGNTSEYVNEKEQIFRSLLELYERSRIGLEKGDLTLQDSRALSDYVAQVTALLREWGKAETARGRSHKSVMRINDIQSKYHELEGMVKEARNDLLQTVKNKTKSHEA